MKRFSFLPALSGAVLALALAQPAFATPMQNTYQGPSDYETMAWDHDKEKKGKNEGAANKKEHMGKEKESNSAWKAEFDAMKGKHKKKRHAKARKAMNAYKKHRNKDKKMRLGKWKRMGDHKKPVPYVPVPAPSVLMLLSAGLIGVVAVNRRRRSKS